MQCKQVFPAPRTGYRRPAKRHVLATDVQRLASKVSAREIRQSRKLIAAMATATIAVTLAIVACIFLIA
jgi:hypothetical protein